MLGVWRRGRVVRGLMQDRFTYSTQRRNQLMLYVDEGFEVPRSIFLEDSTGAEVEFILLDASSLVCDAVIETDPKSGKQKMGKPCGNFDCHRREFGRCQCGRHPAPKFSRQKD